MRPKTGSDEQCTIVVHLSNAQWWGYAQQNSLEPWASLMLLLLRRCCCMPTFQRERRSAASFAACRAVHAARAELACSACSRPPLTVEISSSSSVDFQLRAHLLTGSRTQHRPIASHRSRLSLWHTVAKDATKALARVQKPPWLETIGLAGVRARSFSGESSCSQAARSLSRRRFP